jgi:hypothetical protein
MTKLKTTGQKLEQNSGQSQIVEHRQVKEIIENEIDCPRCYDIMILCSDFDSLYYVCENCDFYLYTIKR